MYPNVVYRRGKQYSYFEIELNEHVSMKFGSLYPHYSSEKWKTLVHDHVNDELKFSSWTLKLRDESVYFITSQSELRLHRKDCKHAFEKASVDSLYFANDLPYLT